MDSIWILVLLVLGLFMLIKPEWLWKIENCLTVKGGEPSDFYLASMRIGGVFFSVCAIGILIYVLVTG